MTYFWYYLVARIWKAKRVIKFREAREKLKYVQPSLSKISPEIQDLLCKYQTTALPALQYFAKEEEVEEGEERHGVCYVLDEDGVRTRQTKSVRFQKSKLFKNRKKDQSFHSVAKTVTDISSANTELETR